MTIDVERTFWEKLTILHKIATLSSIELLPKEAVLNALKEDYQPMSNMIYGNIPEFEGILEFLEKLQEEIHGLE